MAKGVNQLIDEQLRFWTQRSISDHTFRQPEKRLPVITISREFGAKGAALARKLGEQLGFKVWDKDLLLMISEQIGGNKGFIYSLDEKTRDLLEDTIFAFMNQKGTNLNYLLHLIKMVRAIEKHGNSVVVGRGGNYICKDPQAFHVRVVAPLKNRINEYAYREEIPWNEASMIVKQIDSERRDFIRHHFNHDVDCSSDYDLVLNSGTYDMDELAEICISAYETKIGKEVRQLASV